MITVAQLVSDVELELYQGEISDDAALEKDQIKLWLTFNLNNLITQECNSKIERGEQIPAVYISRDELEVPTLDDVDGVDEDDERVYVELEDEVLTLNNDGGVISVETDEGDQVLKMTTEMRLLTRNLRWSKPSLENLLYYHQGPKIYIEGFKPVDLPFSTIHVFYVKKQDLMTMADDDEVQVSDLVLPDVINLTVQRGKLQLYGTMPDVSNNGEDTKDIAYHTAIARPQNQSQ